ncbi:hypothetical protein [Amycolatopsis regifaucium]|jgi:hypothetical protein|uniref:Methionine aminopeptidase n=1 Tax=Amycolatopsis regifaucium TaxID=546365 RepID=A0A154ME22_9PSEU|nr:hypothetical protein [Amycolatopsis regifaucium]KZB82470.1 hypothetical protein AVL48_11270 [Amycolatopsis regifaucium]OKA03409.1 hypothetical protein ATP06_0236430 [Amycolatopsis regifaucium]SFJ42950.1 hypothetical protein SAMN04489731_12130 [Amycolatopsis regifaucium]
MSSDPNPDQGWYFNTKTNQVEHLERGRSIDLLGPYPDEATARRALEIAKERTRQADAEDAKWSGD